MTLTLERELSYYFIGIKPFHVSLLLCFYVNYNITQCDFLVFLL